MHAGQVGDSDGDSDKVRATSYCDVIFVCDRNIARDTCSVNVLGCREHALGFDDSRLFVRNPHLPLSVAFSEQPIR